MSTPVEPRPASGVRVLIADDHVVFRMGLRAFLEGEGMEVLAEASNGEECVRLYREHRPDLLILDMRMPGTDGASALETIRRDDLGARVLILTSYGTEEEVYRALKLGALGFLIKDAMRDELRAAIEKVLQGREHIPYAIACRLAERLSRQELSTREREILRLLTTGLTNREIAHVLGISPSTIKNHLNALYAKLEVSDRTEAATASLTRGLVQM